MITSAVAVHRVHPRVAIATASVSAAVLTFANSHVKLLGNGFTAEPQEDCDALLNRPDLEGYQLPVSGLV